MVEDGQGADSANGERLEVPLPDDVSRGDSVNLSVRPEKIAVDEDIEDGHGQRSRARSRAASTSASMTQITVSLGDGARLVALEQADLPLRADDRWEPGMRGQGRLAPRALPGPALSPSADRDRGRARRALRG